MLEVGNLRGHNDDPDNRSAKLLAEWDDLSRKLGRFIEAGQCRTDHARLAYACLLIMETGIRAGNDLSAEGRECINQWSSNFGQAVQTYGVTTLENRHVSVVDGVLSLCFLGKKAVAQNLSTANPVLVKYAPSGEPNARWLNIEYSELNMFVYKYVGDCYTPKDLRRALVNRLVCQVLADTPLTKKTLNSAIAIVAEQVGHTKAVCKKSYVSRVLIEQAGG